MTDLWLLALGFSLVPFLAVLLQGVSETLRRHEALAWGGLAGILGFLGIAHAGAAILEGNSLLRYEASPLASGAVVAVGVLAGIALAWWFLGRGSRGMEIGANTVIWAAAAYVLLHSVTDGMVLGQAYAGPFPVGFPLDAATVGGTLIHRFAEGALVVVPAIYSGWKPPRTYLPLFAALASVPAAYVPVALLGSATPTSGSVALVQALGVFGAGLEAGFAILLLLLAVVPRALRGRDARWALVAGVTFTALLLVHLLVE